MRRPRADRDEKLVTHGRDRGTRIGLPLQSQSEKALSSLRKPARFRAPDNVPLTVPATGIP